MRITRIAHAPDATPLSRDVEPNGRRGGLARKLWVRRWLLVVLAASMVVALLMAPVAMHAGIATAVTHGPRGALTTGRAASVSNDWAGYATTGVTYTSVSASWRQPSVNCSAGPASYSAYWVGLDGYATRTVEQIGTDSDCSQGSPAYYAWFEMYPAYPVNLSQPVAAGDVISASVASDGSGSFTLTIADTTRHWTYTTHQASSLAQLGSAEWIAEVPSNGHRALPLADFGTVTFTNATANGIALGSNPNLDEIQLGSSHAGIEATPSSLSASGTSFSVTSNVSSGSGMNSGAGSTSPYPTSPYPTSPTAPHPGHHHHWWDTVWSWSQAFGGWGG